MILKLLIKKFQPFQHLLLSIDKTEIVLEPLKYFIVEKLHYSIIKDSDWPKDIT